MKRNANANGLQRILTMVLAVVMLISIVPTQVYAETDSTVIVDNVQDESTNDQLPEDSDEPTGAKISSNAGEQVFAVGQDREFSMTIQANDDAAAVVRGTVTFSCDVNEAFYKQGDGEWVACSDSFGAAEGFTLEETMDYTFRVKFTADNALGQQTITFGLVDTATAETVCQQVVQIQIRKESPISFGETDIEIKFSDSNSVNDTLENDVEDAEFTYKSSDESVVKVSEGGILWPQNLGTATITVTRNETDLYFSSEATYRVTIVQGQQNALTWENTVPIEICWNDENGFANTVTGGSGMGKITYSSSDPSIAEVDAISGELKMKKSGVVTITATKAGDENYAEQTATYTLNVSKAPQSISFEKPSYDMISGTVFDGFDFIDGFGTGEVTYTTDSDLITVNNTNGTVISNGGTGTATIIARKAADDQYYEASAEYTLNVVYADAVDGSYKIDATMGENGWYTDQVNIKAAEGYRISADGTNWTDSLEDVVKEDGTQEVAFYIKDEQTGAIAVKSISLKKDTELPSASIHLNEITTWEKILTIITLGMWEPDDLKFTVSCNDVTSGVDSIQYRIISDEDGKQEWTEYVDAIEVPSNKRFVLEVKVEDRAGLCQVVATNEVISDKAGPSVVLELKEERENNYYTEDVAISISVEDGNPSSGLKTVSYDIILGGEVKESNQLYTYQIDTDPAYEDLDSSLNIEIKVEAADYNADNIVVRVTASDNAGNTTSEEIMFHIYADQPKLDVDDPYGEYQPKRTLSIETEGNVQQAAFHLAKKNNNIFKNNTSYRVKGYFKVENYNGLDDEQHKVTIGNEIGIYTNIGNTDGWIPFDVPYNTTGSGNADWFPLGLWMAEGTFWLADMTIEDESGIVVYDLAKDSNLSPGEYSNLKGGGNIDQSVWYIGTWFNDSWPFPQKGFARAKISNATDQENTQYFNEEKTATITVEARPSVFEMLKPEIIVEGAENTYTVGDWESNGDKHTIQIAFQSGSQDGHTFTVNYTDPFGNQCYYRSGKFVVDTDPPELTIEVNEASWLQGTLESLLFWIPFKGKVKVDITAEDATTQIDEISYYVSYSKEPLTTEQLDNVEWESYINPFELSDEQYFVVYAKATDKVGNVGYSRSDGLLIDNSKCEIVLVPDEYQLYDNNGDGLFGDNFNVSIQATDKTPYSGISKIEYKVLCNGVVTKDYTEISFNTENDDEKSVATATVTINAKDNSGAVRVYVRVTDKVGNESEVYTDELRVDATRPSIHIQFNNDGTVINGRGYFQRRQIEISVKREWELFNAQKATDGIKITAKDSDGNDLSIMPIISQWQRKTVDDVDIHTAIITITEEGRYTFDYAYTDEAGHEGVVNYEDGTIAPNSFVVDTTMPDGSVIVKQENWEAGTEKRWDDVQEELTFGLRSTKPYIVSAEIYDLNPVEVYYIAAGITPLSVEQLEAEDWELLPTELEIAGDFKGCIYLKILDAAGNVRYVSTNGLIVDNSAPVITLTPDKTELYHNDIPMYGGDVNVAVQVGEMGVDTYSGLQCVEYWVMCDGEETQREMLYPIVDPDTMLNPTWDMLKKAYVGEIIVESALNNSCDVVVYVKATDNLGNSNTVQLKLDIDITEPEVQVSFDNNQHYIFNAGKGYYATDRTATIVVKQRVDHFVSDAFKIDITLKDKTGTEIDGMPMISEWEPDAQAGIHTRKIYFVNEGHYTLALSYWGITNESAKVDSATKTPFSFAIDKEKPVGKITVGDVGTWDKLAEVLTFGLWRKTEQVVSIHDVNDSMTDVASVSYYKTSKTKLMTREELKTANWIQFNGLTIGGDERFVIYVRLIDYAGNVEYISTNGIIVDDQAPEMATITPMGSVSNGIFNGDVTVGVSVNDPGVGDTDAFTGIREVRYEVWNLGKMTMSDTLFSFEEQDPLYNKLVSSWSKNDAFTIAANENNSNDVKIVVYVIDNAGNESKSVEIIQIDCTAPEFSVQFTNDGLDDSYEGKAFFNKQRTAVLKVKERNFAPELLQLQIENSDGYIPAISEWVTIQGTEPNGDDTLHMAEVVFDADGDYSLAYSCADLAGNPSGSIDFGESMAYNGFTIDTTAPVVTVKYDNNEAANNNFYKEGRVATITVMEHNFDEGRVVLSFDAVKPVVEKWIHDGDTHTLKIKYSSDGQYKFDITCKDMASNDADDFKKQTFYVDKTLPNLEIDGVFDRSANKGESNIGITITATDINLSEFTPLLHAVIMEDGKMVTKQIPLGDYITVVNGRKYVVENLEDDGIYWVTCKLTDKAGNHYDRVFLKNEDGNYEEYRKENDKLILFSVNRNGSAFAMDDKTTGLVNRYFIQYVENDVTIVEVNADLLKRQEVILNDKKLVEGKDYDVIEDGDENTWKTYKYAINKELFADEGEYRIVVNSTDKAGSDAFSDIKGVTVSFVVDRTAPTVAVSGLDHNGRYQTDTQTVTIMPVDGGGMIHSLLVQLVDTDGNPVQELLNLSGDELISALESGEGKLSVQLSEGLYQNVRIVCTDTSDNGIGEGNVYDFTYRNVSVSSSTFMIFWANQPLRWGTIGGIGVAVLMIALFVIIKKKRQAA